MPLVSTDVRTSFGYVVSWWLRTNTEFTKVCSILNVSNNTQKGVLIGTESRHSIASSSTC